jgi:hypothetical protein
MNRLLALTAALAVALGGTAWAATALHGRGFTTTLPDGWQAKASANGHQVRYALTPSGTQLDIVGVPTSPGMGVTIYSQTRKGLDADYHRHLPRSLHGLWPIDIGLPRDASGVKRTRPRASRLNGRSAIAIRFAYRYHGRDIVQRDLLSARGSRIILVESDADGASDAQALAAVRSITGAFRWR